MKETRSIVATPISETVEIQRQFEPAIAGVGRYPSYRTTEGSEGFQLVDYWRAIRKRLWLVIGIAVLFTTLTAIYVARKPNIYESRAVVQVDNEQNNPDLITADRQRPINNQDSAYFNTQLQILYSDSLLRRVVKEENLDATKEFQALKGGGTSWLSSLSRAIGFSQAPPEMNALDYGDSDSAVATPEEIEEAMRLAPYVDYIRRNLSVDPVKEARAQNKDTRLIEIRFSTTNPALAAKVTNGIAETFTVMNQEKRSGTSRKTNDFLQDRIADLQAQIRDDEQRLTELTASKGILPTSETSTIVLERLAGLNKQLLEAENARKNAEAMYKTVEADPSRLKAQADEATEGISAERANLIQQLQTDTIKKISDLRRERTRLLQEFQPSAPEIKEIEAQIDSYQTDLDKAVGTFKRDLDRYREDTVGRLMTNLRTKYLQAKKQEDEIRAAFNTQYAEAQSQNQGAVSLRLLQQNLESNKGFLDNLRKQVSGNDVAAQGSDNNISVTDPAIPSQTAVSPRRLTTVITALLLSTLFGMGLALFLEYLDDTIRTTEEVENYLQLPALAAIPTIDSMPKRKLLLVGGNTAEEEEERANSELLIYADSNSALAEAYRQLRTSILLSTAGHAPKSLLITSSLPSEGKTTTATNTAISLAQTGAKVLIIDADMRRPRLHQVFGIENGEGLSTLLSSDFTDEDITTIVKQDPGSKLYMLTSGPIPPNPAELIGSEQMANLLKVLQRHFTHVVIDSPPIASFTDGVLIASMVDGVILVVHSGKSSRQIIRRSRQLLQDIGAKIFGVVLNNVNRTSQDNYYYYQSYYNRSNSAEED
jgi:polysaccharide biosynthesis transport protein